MAVTITFVIRVIVGIRMGFGAAVDPCGIDLVKLSVLPGDIVIPPARVVVGIVPPFELGAPVVAPVVLIGIRYINAHVSGIIG